ncbi:MAG: ABC transporter substrate-binding protein [Acidimicrobiales bacterium]
MRLLSSRRALALGAALLSAVSLVATATTAAASSGGSTIPTAPKSSTLAAEVPASVRAMSPVVVAMDETYPPDEFVAANGQAVGMDVDLINAIGQVLGLKLKLENVEFGTIITGMGAGKYEIGMSSFTDTKAREKVVDFVDYFSAGEAFYVAANSKLKLNGLKSLCGHSVSVELGTTEASDAQSQAKKCHVGVSTYSTQSEANLAVSSGRAQIGFADSQVAAYIAAQSKGQFKLSGKAFETAPYGIALPKNGLAKPVLGAVKELISDGIYAKIMDKWGVESGSISKPVINGATS